MLYEFAIVHQIDKGGYYQNTMPGACSIPGARITDAQWRVNVTTLEQLMDIIDNYAHRIEWNNTSLPTIYINT